MDEHAIEIEILADGTVKARVSGAKGPGCLAYARLLERIVGTLTASEPTAESFEPVPPVQLAPVVEQRRQR
ncbi:MAG: DUF2997 domain-containing protein [Planctomycetes bacterium]|nr:DUF2997 domain-containing protein [Planctomycetota bacterium]